jgi:hypothetical protein
MSLAQFRKITKGNYEVPPQNPIEEKPLEEEIPKD